MLRFRFTFLSILLLPGLCGCNQPEVQATPRAYNTFQLITGADSEEEQQHWNELFKAHPFIFGTRPDDTLASSLSLFPSRGRVLLLPMEGGQNAIFLARQGYDVVGVDFSEVALQQARRLARKEKVRILAVNADLKDYDIDPAAYDLIVDLDFNEDRLIREIKRGLRRGGVVFFKRELDRRGRETASFRDKFADFKILSYRQDQREGMASETLVARKVR